MIPHHFNFWVIFVNDKMSSTVVWSSQSALIAVLSLTWLSSLWGWHKYPGPKLTKKLRMVNSIIPVTVVLYHCHSKIKFHPLKATVQIPHVWEWWSSNETTTTAFQAFPVELLVFMDGSSRTSSTPSCSPDPNHVHLAPWLQGCPNPRNSTSGNGTSMKAMENVQCHAMSMAHPKPAHEKIQQTWNNLNLYLTLNIKLRQPNAI